ncbi:MAG: hypothetical protein Barrevirus3_17 [Barrevirus sp.]|uniref:Uncharacterized protein n=1 Tax=Barrevirus sp. TaxID=2487763 RepID=A0A3G4ZPU0_9VIRU|nr:MAG: hypothetical protein Barrevirus3_17 [Barrevirus sp.]
MIGYLLYLYNKVKGYIYTNNNTEDVIPFIIPFDIEQIEKEDAYHKYKNVNQTIFAINNMPNVVHNLLFCGYSTVSLNYYYCNLDLKDNSITHNLINPFDTDLLNDTIKYIFIRINIIGSKKLFDHVNGIYINKNKKYILIFEPKLVLLYDKEMMEEFIRDKTFELHDYKLIWASDLGYNQYNKMQKYDLFCQTYVLFVFILIVLNDCNIINVEEEYIIMFSSIITNKNVSYFLYHIDTFLKTNNYDICQQDELWTLPGINGIKDISNIVKYLITKKEIRELDSQFNIVEEDDLFIIDHSDKLTRSLCTDDVLANPF